MAERKRPPRPTVENARGGPVPERRGGRSAPHHGDTPLTEHPFYAEVLRRDPQLGGQLLADAQRTRGGTYTDLAHRLAESWQTMGPDEREVLFQQSQQAPGLTVLRAMAQRQLAAGAHVRSTDEVARAARAMTDTPGSARSAGAPLPEERPGGGPAYQGRSLRGGGRVRREAAVGGAVRTPITENPLAGWNPAQELAVAQGGGVWGLTQASQGARVPGTTAEAALLGGRAQPRSLEAVPEVRRATARLEEQWVGTERRGPGVTPGTYHGGYYQANQRQADAWATQAGQAMGLSREPGETGRDYFLRTMRGYSQGGERAMTGRQRAAGRAGVLPPKGLPVGMTGRAPVASPLHDDPEERARQDFAQADEILRANVDPEETPVGPNVVRGRTGALAVGSSRGLQGVARRGLPAGVRAASAAERAGGAGPTVPETRGAVPPALAARMAADPAFEAQARGTTALPPPRQQRDRRGRFARTTGGLVPAGFSPRPVPPSPLGRTGYGAPMANRPRYVPGAEGAPGRLLEQRNPVQALEAGHAALRDWGEEGWSNDPRMIAAQAQLRAVERRGGGPALGQAQARLERVREELRREESGDWQLSQREVEQATAVDQRHYQSYGFERGRGGLYPGDSGQLVRNREGALLEGLGSPVFQGLAARLSGAVGALPGAYKETARDYLARTVGGPFATRDDATARGLVDPDDPTQGTNLSDLATRYRGQAEALRRQAGALRQRYRTGPDLADREVDQMGRRIEEADRLAATASERAARAEGLRQRMGDPGYAMRRLAAGMGLVTGLAQYQNPLFPGSRQFAQFLNTATDVDKQVAAQRGLQGEGGPAGLAQRYAPHVPRVLSELFRAQTGLDVGFWGGARQTPTGRVVREQAAALGFRPRGELDAEGVPSGRWTFEQQFELDAALEGVLGPAFDTPAVSVGPARGRFQRADLAPTGGLVEQGGMQRLLLAMGAPPAFQEEIAARFGGQGSIPVGRLPGLREWERPGVEADPELGIFSPMRRLSQWFQAQEGAAGGRLGWGGLTEAVHRELAGRLGWRPEAGAPGPAAVRPVLRAGGSPRGYERGVGRAGLRVLRRVGGAALAGSRALAPPAAAPGVPGSSAGPGGPRRAFSGGWTQLGKGRRLVYGPQQTLEQARALGQGRDIGDLSQGLTGAAHRMAAVLGQGAPEQVNLLSNMGLGGHGFLGGGLAVNPWRMALGGLSAAAGTLSGPELALGWLGEGGGGSEAQRMAHLALRATSHELTHTGGVSHEDQEAFRAAEEANWAKLVSSGTIAALLPRATERVGGVMASPAFQRQARELMAQHEAARRAAGAGAAQGLESAIDLQEELAGPGRAAVPTFAAPGWAPSTPAEAAELARQEAVDAQRYGRFPQPWEDSDSDPAAYEAFVRQQGGGGVAAAGRPEPQRPPDEGVVTSGRGHEAVGPANQGTLDRYAAGQAAATAARGRDSMGAGGTGFRGPTPSAEAQAAERRNAAEALARAGLGPGGVREGGGAPGGGLPIGEDPFGGFDVAPPAPPPPPAGAAGGGGRPRDPRTGRFVRAGGGGGGGGQGGGGGGGGGGRSRGGLGGTSPPGGPPTLGATGLNGTPPPSGGTGMPGMVTGGTTAGQEWVQPAWPGAPGFGRAVPQLGPLDPSAPGRSVEAMPEELARLLEESLAREGAAQRAPREVRNAVQARELRARANLLRAQGQRTEGELFGAPGTPSARGAPAGPLEVTAQTVQVTVPQNGTVNVTQGGAPAGPGAPGVGGGGGGGQAPPAGPVGVGPGGPGGPATPPGVGAFGLTGPTGTRGLQPLGGGGAPPGGGAWPSQQPGGALSGPPWTPAYNYGRGGGGGGGRGRGGRDWYPAMFAAQNLAGGAAAFYGGATSAAARFDRSAWENALARGLLGDETGPGAPGLTGGAMARQMEASRAYRVTASPNADPFAGNPLERVLGGRFATGDRRSAERYMDIFEQERTATAFRQRIDPNFRQGAAGDQRLEQVMRVATMTNTQGPEYVAAQRAAAVALGIDAGTPAGQQRLNQLFLGGFARGIAPDELQHVVAMGGPGLRQAGMSDQEIIGMAVLARQAGLEPRSAAYAGRQLSNLKIAPSGQEFYELQRLFGSGAPSLTALEEQLQATGLQGQRASQQQAERRMVEGSPWRRMEDLGFEMQAQSLAFAETGNVRQERGFARQEANLTRGYGALGRQELALGRAEEGLGRARRGREVEIAYNRFRYGADTPASFSRDAYFAQQRALAEAARTGQPVPDELQQNAPGFEARQFYGGVEHQRRMLVYGQTPWLAGRAYEEQQAELTRQEQLYQEQAAAEIPGRALQAEERDAALKSREAEIADHRAALADSRADLDASREALTDQREALAEERQRLTSQQEMLGLQVEAHRQDLEASWEALTFQQDLLARQAGVEAIGRQPSAEAVAAFAAEYQADPAAITQRLALLTPEAETRVREAMGFGEASAAGNVLVGYVEQQRAENERARAEGRAPVNVMAAAGTTPTPEGMEGMWGDFIESAVGRWLRSALPGQRFETTGGLAANALGGDDLQAYLAAMAQGALGPAMGPLGPLLMGGANTGGVLAAGAGTAFSIMQLLQLRNLAGAVRGLQGAAPAAGPALATAATGGGGAAGGAGVAGGAGGAAALAPFLLPLLAGVGITALVGGAYAGREATQSQAEAQAMRLSPQQREAYTAARTHGYDERLALQIAESRVMEGATEAQWASFQESSRLSPVGVPGELSRRGRGGWTAWGEQGLAESPVVATSEGLPGPPSRRGRRAPRPPAGGTPSTSPG